MLWCKHGTMAIGSPKNFEILLYRSYMAILDCWQFIASQRFLPFCTNSRIIYLDSPSLKLLFDMIIALVHTRYHGDRKPRNFGNSHCRPYMALLECVQFAARQRFVPLLHQLKYYIFGLSFSKASFCYDYCFGANTAPWRQEANKFRKFALSTLYGDTCMLVTCSPAKLCTHFAPNQGLYFWALLP